MKLNPFLPKKIIGIQEAGIGLVSTSNSWDKDQKQADGKEQNVSLQNQYNNAYANFPIVAAAIDTTSEEVVQDFYFEGPNKKKLTGWADKHNLGHLFYLWTKLLLKNGNCWVEFSDDEVKTLDPIWMRTWRKTNGEVIGHTQEIQNYKVIWGSTGDKNKDSAYVKKSDLKNIVHMKFNALHNEKYGNSLIHSVLYLLKIKMQIEADFSVIVKRYAAPIIHAKVGDENHMPSDDDITNVKNQITDIYSDTEYATNHLVEMNVLGFQGKSMDLSEPMKRIDMNIIAGLQCPGVLIDLDESGKESAEVKLRKFGRHVKAIQRILKIEFEDKVIVGQDLGNEKDKLIWGSAEEREQEVDFDILRGLVKDGLITPQKANDLLPPDYHEKLPDLSLVGPIGTPGNPQNQGPYQKGGDKVKDNPNDPRKKQRSEHDVVDNRVNKSDKKVPLK